MPLGVLTVIKGLEKNTGTDKPSLICCSLTPCLRSISTALVKSASALITGAISFLSVSLLLISFTFSLARFIGIGITRALAVGLALLKASNSFKARPCSMNIGSTNLSPWGIGSGEPCSLVIKKTGITANFLRASASGMALAGAPWPSRIRLARAPLARRGKLDGRKRM